MEPFSIHTTLTLDDWRAFQRACALRIRQQGKFARKWSQIAFWMAVGVAVSVVVTALELDLHGMSVALGVAFGFGLMVVAQKRASRVIQPRAGSSFLSPTEHEFNAEGMTSVKPESRTFSRWSRVIEITTTSEHIFIWSDTFAAYVIPIRDLPPGMTAEQVVAAFKEWMAASAPPLDLPPALPRTTNSESWWRAAFRLLTLRSVEHSAAASALSGRPMPILMLSLFSLALWVGLSWFYYLPEPKFYPYNAPALAWYVLAALAVAIVMSKRSHPEIAFARVCLLVAIVLPVLIAADFAIAMWVPERWSDGAHIFLGLYAIWYGARGVEALSGKRQPVAVLGGFAVAVMFLWVANATYIYPAVWTSEDPDEYAQDLQADNDAAEALLFEQPARIDASVARIERPADDGPVGFFLGFAGYGEQRVFAEEIKFAAGKFADRFGTAARTLFLINDRRDRQDEPLATVAGLRYALKALASKMRIDRDVLFLTLSSHGSEDPLLSVENGSLPLRDLSGDDLAAALQESGIKWRVIVISACHAGAFIESLRNPYTIVITAASPDRTSFGCSDDRDLTYFGEAFFRDSLPQAASLRDAFDTATKLVSEREEDEGFEASKPQAFFGESIEPRLESLLRSARTQ